jgi:hypothetical protein
MTVTHHSFEESGLRPERAVFDRAVVSLISLVLIT